MASTQHDEKADLAFLEDSRAGSRMLGETLQNLETIATGWLKWRRSDVQKLIDYANVRREQEPAWAAAQNERAELLPVQPAELADAMCGALDALKEQRPRLESALVDVAVLAGPSRRHILIAAERRFSEAERACLFRVGGGGTWHDVVRDRASTALRILGELESLRSVVEAQPVGDDLLEQIKNAGNVAAVYFRPLMNRLVRACADPVDGGRTINLAARLQAELDHALGIVREAADEDSGVSGPDSEVERWLRDQWRTTQWISSAIDYKLSDKRIAQIVREERAAGRLDVCRGGKSGGGGPLLVRLGAILDQSVAALQRFEPELRDAALSDFKEAATRGLASGGSEREISGK